MITSIRPGISWVGTKSEIVNTKISKDRIIEDTWVPPLDAPARLSIFARGQFKALPSNKSVKKAIESGRMYVDGRPGFTGTKVRGGEHLELLWARDMNPATFDLDTEVLYEDDHLAAVLKPAGIVVSGNQRRTIQNGLSGLLNRSNHVDSLPVPQPIHRLDYATSGVVLVAKTGRAALALGRLFEARSVMKTYHAVVIGKPVNTTVINTFVYGKPALTRLELVKSIPSPKFGALSLVRLLPSTGRRHQLRIHMLQLGCPILGDKTYYIPGRQLYGKGMYLHATSLAFDHPVTKTPLVIRSRLPRKILKLFPDITY